MKKKAGLKSVICLFLAVFLFSSTLLTSYASETDDDDEKAGVLAPPAIVLESYNDMECLYKMLRQSDDEFLKYLKNTGIDYHDLLKKDDVEAFFELFFEAQIPYMSEYGFGNLGSAFDMEKQEWQSINFKHTLPDESVYTFFVSTSKDSFEKQMDQYEGEKIEKSDGFAEGIRVFTLYNKSMYDSNHVFLMDIKGQFVFVTSDSSSDEENALKTLQDFEFSKGFVFYHDLGEDAINVIFNSADGQLERVLGDVSDDDKISAVDARKALRVSARLDDISMKDRVLADVNYDGEITAVDARIILRVSARLESFDEIVLRPKTVKEFLIDNNINDISSIKIREPFETDYEIKYIKDVAFVLDVLKANANVGITDEPATEDVPEHMMELDFMNQYNNLSFSLRIAKDDTLAIPNTWIWNTNEGWIAKLAISIADKNLYDFIVNPDNIFASQLKNPVVLSAEQEERIKADWIATWEAPTPDEPSVDLKYYGSYGDCVALMIFDSNYFFIQVLNSELIDGVTFRYRDSNKIQIWHDGEFLSVASAYAQELLTKDDLLNIAHFHHQRQQDIVLKLGESFTLDTLLNPGHLVYNNWTCSVSPEVGIVVEYEGINMACIATEPPGNPVEIIYTFTAAKVGVYDIHLRLSTLLENKTIDEFSFKIIVTE